MTVVRNKLEARDNEWETTKSVTKIEIEKLTKDDEERNDDRREKMLDDRQWWRGDDGRSENEGDEMKMLREWGRRWVEDLIEW